MHLPSASTTAVYSSSSVGNISADWSSGSAATYKGGMLEPPPNGSGSSSPQRSQQDLWWTERLVLEAQQEYPGELGNVGMHFSCFRALITKDYANFMIYPHTIYLRIHVYNWFYVL